MRARLLVTAVVALAASAATAVGVPEQVPVAPAPAQAAIDPCASANCARMTIDSVAARVAAP